MNEKQTLHRFKLILEYNGSRYKGFQRQSSGVSADCPLDSLVTHSPRARMTPPANKDDNSPGISEIPSRRSRSIFIDKNQMDILALVPGSPTMSPPEQKRGGQRIKRKRKDPPLTIQETLEDALELYTGLSRQVLRLRFAGRTDGGVHARGQVVAVSLPKHVAKEKLWLIRRNINSRLPGDISVAKISSLADWPDFDPRKDVIRKRYSYTMRFRRKVLDSNGEPLPICMSGPNSIRSALDHKMQWICPWALDDSNMRAFCHQLTGYHDYSSFVQKQSRRLSNNELMVESFDYEVVDEIKEEAPVLTIRLQVIAKGFRQGMVRNLVGFIVDLCRGQVPGSVFNTIWTGTDEVASLVHSAPPFGLCMESVEYPAGREKSRIESG